MSEHLLTGAGHTTFTPDLLTSARRTVSFNLYLTRLYTDMILFCIDSLRLISLKLVNIEIPDPVLSVPQESLYLQ